MLRLFGPGCSPTPIEGDVKSLPADVVWIDLLEPTKEEEKLVEKLVGHNIPTRDELAEIEPSSRLYERKGAAYMTVSMLYGISDGQPATDPVGFVLTDKHLVTIRYVDPKPFIVFADHAYAEPELTSTSRSALVLMLDAIVDRLADEFEAAGDEIEQVNGRVFEHGRAVRERSPEMRLEALLMRVGRSQQLIATLRVASVSLFRMLTFLAKCDAMDKDSTNKRHVDSLVADISALSDHSTFLGDQLTFLLDATLGLISLQQNKVMKIFSVVAVVLMPPTLVAGIYGMNFKYMPELEWLHGYPLALILMLASAVIPYSFARRMGWL